MHTHVIMCFASYQFGLTAPSLPSMLFLGLDPINTSLPTGCPKRRLERLFEMIAGKQLPLGRVPFNFNSVQQSRPSKTHLIMLWDSPKPHAQTVNSPHGSLFCGSADCTLRPHALHSALHFHRPASVGSRQLSYHHSHSAPLVQ